MINSLFHVFCNSWMYLWTIVSVQPGCTRVPAVMSQSVKHMQGAHVPLLFLFSTSFQSTLPVSWMPWCFTPAGSIVCCSSGSGNRSGSRMGWEMHDYVPRNRLLRTMRLINIDEKVLNWVKEYLSDRQQAVVINNVSSSFQFVISGVPQGSIIGSTLFFIYIKDLHQSIQS